MLPLRPYQTGQVYKKVIVFIAACLLSTSFLLAQIDSSGISKNEKDTLIAIDPDHSGNMDIIDVYHHLFNKHNNPHGIIAGQKNTNYHASLVPAVGYTLQTGWAGIISANVGFYTSNAENANLSTALLNIEYTQFSQILLPLQTNIWSKNNKVNFQGDWRYYKYPQNTYGLGSNTTTDQANPVDYSYIRFYQVAMSEIGRNMYLGGGYMLDYHWNISEEGNEDGSQSDFDKYGFKSKSISSGVSANFLYDSRKNPINPSKGFYANVSLRNNFTFLGSDNNSETILIDVRKYIKPSKNSDNILAFWSYNAFTLSGTPSYLDLPSNGWDTYNNTGRGYVQGRFRGQNMIYLESEYRFSLSRNKLFGGVVFANAESFSEWPSNKFETILPGGGVGLRLQINKHSKTNLGIDYGWGRNGSGGIFINLGEVF